ncbi:hypothetical protein ABN028_19565 [Actinopolymorpha sp. B17G11]|uniref:hypothetical protein n=1 Tax=Actinopolymorpha sp. B17G11 TaxID=3160861 RepID=UPI0032E48024
MSNHIEWGSAAGASAELLIQTERAPDGQYADGNTLVIATENGDGIALEGDRDAMLAMLDRARAAVVKHFENYPDGGPATPATYYEDTADGLCSGDRYAPGGCDPTDPAAWCEVDGVEIAPDGDVLVWHEGADRDTDEPASFDSAAVVYIASDGD